MIRVTIVFLACTMFFACREQKQEPATIPVETDNGIGDGAPSLDTLIKKQQDSISNLIKKDSL